MIQRWSPQVAGDSGEPISRSCIFWVVQSRLQSCSKGFWFSRMRGSGKKCNLKLKKSVYSQLQFFVLQSKWEFKWTAWLPVQKKQLKPSWSPAVAASSTRERRLCEPSNDKIIKAAELCPSLILLENLKMSRIITIPKSRKLWSTIADLLYT